jgi:phosphoribosylformylglycinamidine synthase
MVYDLARAAQACYHVASAFKTPFISGKDSLYNESELGPVTPTLLISAVGIIPDIRKSVSMDVKEPDNSVYIIGKTRDELGGSHYYKVKGLLGKNVPVVRAKSARKTFDSLTKAIDSGVVKSCHDLSEGGLAVTAAEMAFSGGLGMEIDLTEVPIKGALGTDALLFSESQSRFLVEVSDEKRFEKIMAGNVFSRIGRTKIKGNLLITKNDKEVINVKIERLRRSWLNGA